MCKYQVLQMAIGTTLYIQRDERVHHIFLYALVGHKMSVSYVNKARYVQKILELYGSNKSALSQAELHP